MFLSFSISFPVLDRTIQQRKLWERFPLLGLLQLFCSTIRRFLGGRGIFELFTRNCCCTKEQYGGYITFTLVDKERIFSVTEGQEFLPFSIINASIPSMVSTTLQRYIPYFSLYLSLFCSSNCFVVLPGMEAGDHLGGSSGPHNEDLSRSAEKLEATHRACRNESCNSRFTKCIGAHEIFSLEVSLGYWILIRTSALSL